MRDLLLALGRSRLGLFGAALTTASGVLIVVLTGMAWLGYDAGPYVGVLAYLILPAIFVVGLILMPIGALLARRRARGVLPVIDLNRDVIRRMLFTFLAATALNVAILGVATYEGAQEMESVRFCGTSCHVMNPEYTAYQRSAHASVPCVACHIGAGAGAVAQAKLNGSRQAILAALDRYDRPIAATLHKLPSARETCERCHSRTRRAGDALRVTTHFDADESNTKKYSVMMLHIGGSHDGVAHGIHWHMDPGTRIRYRSDATGDTIPEVELTTADGKTKTFRTQPAPGEAPTAHSEWRSMDCLDCHNRPAHVFHTAERELDAALELGTMDATLPFLKRESRAALEADYASHEQARAEIERKLVGFYREHHADLFATRSDVVEKSARAAADIYCANVFPAMKIGWGTYPSHIGHQDSAGCFRCHDDLHTTASGETISQDCGLCHTVLAMDEENPSVLSQLKP